MDFRKVLEETGALLHGHFLLSSGLHSDTYIQCAKILKYPWYAQELGYEISMKVSVYDPDCIVSPAIGGIIIGYEVAKHLSLPFLFTERDESGYMKFRREFDPSGYKRIVIVEDVVTTGKSTGEVIVALKNAGAEVVCASAIANRGETHEITGLPLKALIDLPLKHYEVQSCPMCKSGIELVKPGTRKF